MSKDWEPCPRCGSNKVTTIGKLAMFFVLLGSGSCLIWVGILFPPIWIFAGLLILASPLGFAMPKMNTCKDCNYNWKVGKVNEYKKAIDDIKEVTEENEKVKTEPIVIKKKDEVESEPLIETEHIVIEAEEPIKEVVVSERQDSTEQTNKDISFSFHVVGLNYENRRRKLTKIINEYKKDGWFFMEPYEGMTNKEILNEPFIDRVYELTAELLPNCIIEKEDTNEYDPNALKFLVEDVDGVVHHIGYVPKEHCVEIRKYIDEYDMQVIATIEGGKYKEVDYNDYEEEKVVTRNSNYNLNIILIFR